MEFNYLSEMLEADNRGYKYPKSGFVVDTGSSYLFKLKNPVNFSIYEQKYLIDKVLMTTKRKSDYHKFGYRIVYVLNDGKLLSALYGVNHFKVSINIVMEICLMLKEYEILSKNAIYKYSKRLREDIEIKYNKLGKNRKDFVFSMEKFLSDYETFIEYEKIPENLKGKYIPPAYLPACDKFNKKAGD